MATTQWLQVLKVGDGVAKVFSGLSESVGGSFDISLLRKQDAGTVVLNVRCGRRKLEEIIFRTARVM